MRKILFFIVIFALFFFSCNKDNKDSSNTDDNNFQETIYYKDFIPDTAIIVEHDSSTYFDINNDSVFDFHFHLKHWIEYFGPHPKDCYDLYLIASDSLKFIIHSPKCFLICDVPSDQTMYINSHDSISKFFDLYVDALDFGCACFMNSSYIGFILIKKGVKYFGWIHLQVIGPSWIVIDNVALLLSKTDSVRYGSH
jgi:hypothetical protein